jgi:hypothetical protein
MCDLWWVKWQGATFCLSIEVSPCRLSFHRCSTLICHQTLVRQSHLRSQDQSTQFHRTPITKRSWYSVVGIVTRNSCSIPQKGKWFFSSSKRPVRLWTPLRLLLYGYWELLPWEGVRWSECEAHHSPPLLLRLIISGAISLLPMHLFGVDGDNFIFYYIPIRPYHGLGG